MSTVIPGDELPGDPVPSGEAAPAGASPGDAAAGGAPAAVPPGAPVRLYPLTYLDEGDEVTVGRPDIDSYAVLPADGAALLRRLGDGVPPAQAAAWYRQTYGEPVDIDDFVDTLRELDFVRQADDDAEPAARPVRWRALGAAVFSPVGAVCLAALLTAWVVAMVRSPGLVPTYHNLFFTRYMTVLELVTFVCQFPLILLHEAAHALAGRRLGLRSRLSIGRRLYYVVFQTTMDGLVSVPRRKRYVPMLAGILTDLAVLAALTLGAAATEGPDGHPSTTGRILLALAYMTLLRVSWQLWFYLETDLYYVVVTVLDCVDLQATARDVLRQRLNRLLGRPHTVPDETRWHPRDLSVSRWYSWLLLVGWTVSIGTLLAGVLPVAVRVLSTVLGRLVTSHTHGTAGLLDSVGFLVINLAQLAVIAHLVRRERRARRARSSDVPS
ncbi:hypothetical protein [Streptomyces sp. ICBB 8177]|uniref:hypothetical protein n=1 Tax=Streptomyces sp. ICBB 8177 TaxID=563922 RepID=UPI0013053A5A|nr:hypothetical protein [Streptomyces sp. ICBB 8177]